MIIIIIIITCHNYTSTRHAHHYGYTCIIGIDSIVVETHRINWKRDHVIPHNLYAEPELSGLSLMCAWFRNGCNCSIVIFGDIPYLKVGVVDLDYPRP